MVDSSASISTRRASELLGVHESTVKRWCNDQDLLCRHTKGGHRRIPLGSLLAFARVNDLPLDLLVFDGSAEKVWHGAEAIERNEDYSGLISLLYEWLDAERVDLVVHLLSYLHRQDRPLSRLFDRLVGPVMFRIGSAYLEGSLSIGDEHRMTQTMRDALVQLRRPQPANGHMPPSHRVAVVGCPRNEAHELGALMVRVTLEHLGWRVAYLGLDVPTEEFALQQRKHRAELVCVSVVPPTTIAEAAAMARLLGHMASVDSAYRLAFGGSAISRTCPPIPAHPGIPEIRLFHAMSPFAEWVASL